MVTAFRAPLLRQQNITYRVCAPGNGAAMLFCLPGTLNINGARSAAKPPENEFMALASTPAQQREQ